MSVRFRRPSKSVVFAMLMVTAAALSLLPVAWTRWMRGVLQPLVWVQGGVTALVHSTFGGAPSSPDAVGAPITPEEWQRVLEENQQLQKLQLELGHMSLHVAELERRLAEATGIRDQLRDSRTSLVLATVVGYDAAPQQETLLISKGQLAGVAKGQWVAAAAPAEPSSDGRQLLARQWLIGRISEVQPYSSRVQLATDGRFKERVKVAKILPNGAWQPWEQTCILDGRGGSRMVIERATQDYFRLGCLVVLVPASADLPAPFTIGRIESSHALDQSPLYYDLEVRPWGDFRQLEYVYVINTFP